MVRSITLDHAALTRMLRAQHAVVSRAGALACGMTGSALRHRLRPGGPWQLLLPGVYLTVTGTMTLHDQHAGPGVRAGPRRGSSLLRAALEEVADSIRSVAEGDFRTLLKRGRLPMPMFNARLYDDAGLIAMVDAWWPQAGLAAEVDSRDWHLSPQHWERTMRRP